MEKSLLPELNKIALAMQPQTGEMEGKGGNIPMVVNRVVYAGDDKGIFFAVDASTGSFPPFQKSSAFLH